MTFSIRVQGHAPKGIGRDDEMAAVSAAVERLAARLEAAGLVVSYATVNGDYVRGEEPVVLAPATVPAPAPAPKPKVAPKRRA